MKEEREKKHHEQQQNTTSDQNETKLSRRDMLKMVGVGGLGLLVGASGMGGVIAAANHLQGDSAKTKNKSGSMKDDIVPFYGEYQAGITTEVQNFVYVAAFDLVTTKRSDVIALFKDWTKATENMTQGLPVEDTKTSQYLPPVDTGEAEGLAASQLTITFGVSAQFFVKDGIDRFGIKAKRPQALIELPHFAQDALQPEWMGGDIVVQVCADDQQVAFHALRNLIRRARGVATMRWNQAGFQRTKQADVKGETVRNLFGFKDGTGNPNVKDPAQLNQHVWVQPNDGPDWMVGGSYMVYRRIQMRLEVWDRTNLSDQELTFGRHRASGAPLGGTDEFEPLQPEKLPDVSHARIAHGDGSIKILRRSYSYADGMDGKTGTLNAGLLFLCYQRDPIKQFIPMQHRLAKNDKLNEYIVHRGSGLFACFPGVKKGSYIGEGLFR
ncbi:iron uptake transporter deferrochelatase/peroxidase subunit [Brevibacillus laterosporus]|uniref:iron uptake transporter deferrochelatase/peroxidase subunit n=1 Tax=Brevibacillus laterosporus TaxID=1465 RepID=UPI000E6D1A5F|nr:iron uptake transporter deferrochelatase/peroxidase subunit [Brevibacillus laterosporus]AYB39305.1 deferrochelatase/peroxidase EfeB [Brevibacillus laterosporus]MBG9796314.1 deferrochelatase [Brevibacillus laterosporus]MBM7108635.1 putative deferrochelatase/peroxidase EfeN precursor [Brevibacillus laterosporus]MCR8937319.1 iron uptake transporter deferrochelatase/peroxidase subunit [Brevibacillus laterosporus]MCZ0839958.1 iron uptake transporter deferrochelatase/peroxidase subunit [Brevibaci